MRKQNNIKIYSILTIGAILIISIIIAFSLLNKKDSDIKTPSAEVLMELTTDSPKKIIEYNDNGWSVTAYCACIKCCGEYALNRKNNIVVGAQGNQLISGYSAANNELSFGTLVYVEGYGLVEIQDRTANWINKRYNGKIIDIYFDSHEEALNFGKMTDVNVKIIK